MANVSENPKFTLKERLDIFIARGFTAIAETGQVFNPAGELRTTKSATGYIHLSIAYKINNKSITLNLKAHQLIWYLHYKEVPSLIDHKNRIRHDDKIENLRIATHQTNVWNTETKGYHWNKAMQKWQVGIKVNGKKIHLGYYDEESEAKRVYDEAKIKRENGLPIEKFIPKNYYFDKLINKWVTYRWENGQTKRLDKYDIESDAKEAALRIRILAS